MQVSTMGVLADYVTALIKDEGVDAVHVTNLIPPYRLGMDKKWTQFPKLGAGLLKQLREDGVMYDQPSGWFRRIP